LSESIVDSGVSNIEVISATPLYNAKEARDFYEWCVASGFEGAIFRNPDDLYLYDQRTWSITKKKPLIHEEYIIIGSERDSRGAIIWWCGTNDGERFKVVPEGSIESRQDIQRPEDSYGKPLTVAFYEYTDKRIPRHGKGVAIRDYE